MTTPKLALVLLGVVIVAVIMALTISGGKAEESMRAPVIPAHDKEKLDMRDARLTDMEKHVILNKGTERPFSGKYVDHHAEGYYTCKRCGARLFESQSKFDSQCGWPSFDENLPGAVERIPDADGMRTEIVCAACKAHLGHVFEGEHFTEKNTRHCVNSISLNFTSADQVDSAKAEAYFAGGCFWGVEYYMEEAPGVLDVSSGYMGGQVENPSYEQVCSGRTGHAEAVRVVYDPSKISYEDLARLFFEIHDPTQVNRQGPDIGEQYRSAIYVKSDEEREIVSRLIDELKESGFAVSTKLEMAGPFYPAEEYHQNYYEKTGKQPYCHRRVTRFKRK